jgi:hypothetical protein
MYLRTRNARQRHSKLQDCIFNNQTSSCFGRSDKNHKYFWQNSESRVRDLKRIQVLYEAESLIITLRGLLRVYRSLPLVWQLWSDVLHNENHV